MITYEHDGYSASIIADSIGPNHVRLVTGLLRMPRFILPEITRHRSFSFSVGSSRARPYKRQASLLKCPVVFWGKQKAGMSATEEVRFPKLAAFLWWLSSQFALLFAWLLNRVGVHKQITNRIIEPFIFVDVVMTGIDSAWEHLFFLRIEKSAQPEAQKIVRLAARAYRDSKPIKLEAGEYHLPYITNEERDSVKYGTLFMNLVKASAARCARTSFKNHDGSSCKIESDIKLYDKLVESHHWSPLEHVARACLYRGNGRSEGNFPGWIQHRKEVESSPFSSFDWGVLGEEHYVV